MYEKKKILTREEESDIAYILVHAAPDRVVSLKKKVCYWPDIHGKPLIDLPVWERLEIIFEKDGEQGTWRSIWGDYGEEYKGMEDNRAYTLEELGLSYDAEAVKRYREEEGWKD